MAGWASLGTDFAFSQTWTQTSAPLTNWTCVAISADGTKLAATMAPGGIYISTNSGNSWRQCANAPVSTYRWSSIACSADGSKLVATSDSHAPVAAFPGWVYISTSSGANWAQASAPGGIMNWATSVAAANGAKMTVADYMLGSFYTSTNSGMNWYSNNAPAKGWTRLAASADGVWLAAIVHGGGIYTSTNFGTALVSNNVGSKNWSSIAASGDGMKLAAVVYGGGIYISTNAGTDWIQTTAPVRNWVAVASSTDGSRLGAAVSSGGIYLSTNSGSVWTQTSAPSTNWTSIAVSADGSKWVAASAKGGIYSCYLPNAPWLNLLSGSNRVTFSWIMPATNLVLQRTTNLTVWSNVTNASVLDLTNLQNQTVLTPSNRSGFFRLKSQ